MNKNLKTTLKFSLATVIGASVLCGATEMVAKWCFGIELPVQSQVDFVKSYVGWNRVFAAIVAQAVLLMPALEEIVFRWLLWKLPLSLAHKWSGGGRIAIWCGEPYEEGLPRSRVSQGTSPIAGEGDAEFFSFAGSYSVAGGVPVGTYAESWADRASGGAGTVWFARVKERGGLCVIIK